MSDFKAKMHQIQCRLRLRPKPRCGSLHRSSGLAGFKGPPSKGKEGLEEGEGKGGKRMRGDEREVDPKGCTPMCEILKRTLTAELI